VDWGDLVPRKEWKRRVGSKGKGVKERFLGRKNLSGREKDKTSKKGGGANAKKNEQSAKEDQEKEGGSRVLIILP